jgi:hypothetical protein
MHGFTARRFRRTAAAALAAASLTALAACGGGDDKAAEKAAEKPSGKTVTTAPATADGSPLSGVVHGRAALDLVKQATDGVHSVRLTTEVWQNSLRAMSSRGVMDWSDGLTGDMTVDFTEGEMAQDLAEGDMPPTARILYLPGHMYMNVGNGAAARELDGKHWVDYDLKALSAQGESSATSLLLQLENSTPPKSVRTLLTAPNMKSLGPATVTGVATTHYQAVVDGKGTALADSGITSETVDLYVTKDNLPVQASILLDTRGGRMRTVTTYSDYGVAVHPQAPPAFDVASLDEAMASGD